MSHSTSALGQWATARCSKASSDSLQDRGTVTTSTRATRSQATSAEKTVTASKFDAVNDLPDFYNGESVGKSFLSIKALKSTTEEGATKPRIVQTAESDGASQGSLL